MATLILAGSYAGWKGSLPAAEVRARVAAMRRMVAAPDDEFDPTLPGPVRRGAAARSSHPCSTAIAADVRPDSLRTQLSAMAGGRPRDLLARIAVPTLLIWGELDARSPLSVAGQFEEAIADTSLVVIPGCGHVSDLERPEEFNDAVRGFCRDHPPRPDRIGGFGAANWSVSHRLARPPTGRRAGGHPRGRIPPPPLIRTGRARLRPPGPPQRPRPSRRRGLASRRPRSPHVRFRSDGGPHRRGLPSARSRRHRR